MRLFQSLVASLLLVSPALAEPPADLDPQIELTQPGVQLSLVAEHPAIMTPTGIDIDDQGKLWVVSSHTHFRPDDYDGPLHDQILVFAGDRDADPDDFF